MLKTQKSHLSAEDLLSQWCEGIVQRITADFSEDEVHPNSGRDSEELDLLLPLTLSPTLSSFELQPSRLVFNRAIILLPQFIMSARSRQQSFP